MEDSENIQNVSTSNMEISFFQKFRDKFVQMSQLAFKISYKKNQLMT